MKILLQKPGIREIPGQIATSRASNGATLSEAHNEVEEDTWVRLKERRKTKRTETGRARVPRG